jgi:hydrogenase-4 component C
MPSFTLILVGLLQALGLLAAAPLVSGLSRVLRAKMHSRRGPSLFQNYRDLAKLMKRQEVVSSQAGWIFRLTPYVSLAALLLVAALVPILITKSPFGFAGDLILVIYLFALARVFGAMAALETGSSFGGIGARRELFVSMLVEPVLLLVLFVMALLAGSTNLGVISAQVAAGGVPFYTSVWLGMLAFAFAVYVEMGKLPFDLGEAEQELQEGPLSEYTGRALALMKWSGYLKQLVLVSLFLAVFLPFGAATGAASGWELLPALLLAGVTYGLKVGLITLLIAGLENAMARVRFVQATTPAWAALAAAILSFVFYLANV